MTGATRAADFIARLHDAVNRHDAERIAQLCAAAVIWTDPAALAPLHGRAAVRRFHAEQMFRAIPDVNLQMIDGPYLSACGTRIAARVRIGGTMTGPLDPPGFAPTGERIVFETAEFSVVENGLLTRHTVIMDMLDLARQIGALPAAESMVGRAALQLQRLHAFRSRHRP
jgi:predicted ester cyclase